MGLVVLEDKTQTRRGTVRQASILLLTLLFSRGKQSKGFEKAQRMSRGLVYVAYARDSVVVGLPCDRQGTLGRRIN